MYYGIVKRERDIYHVELETGENWRIVRDNYTELWHLFAERGDLP